MESVFDDEEEEVAPPPARRGRAAERNAAATADDSKSKQGKGKAKRKMVIDDEIQLSTEQIRRQLNDPSNLVRDFAAEAAAAAAAASSADAAAASGRFAGSSSSAAAHALFGPPMLAYLPSAVATMAIFQQTSLESRPLKKAKKGPTKGADDGRRSSTSAADAAAAAAGGVNDEDAPPAEAWRSGHQQDADGVAAPSDPLADAVMPADDASHELPVMDEAGLADGGFDEFADEGFGDAPPLDEEAAAFEEEVAEEMDESREPQAAGFDPSRELPDVDDMAGAEAPTSTKGNSQSQSLGAADPHAWSQRTAKMYTMLSAAFDESEDAPLSYFAMAKQTRHSANKRKVVAGCFQELLFLTTHGIIELDQRKAFANILISKTENFDKAAKINAAK